jgi:hypothetical protein
VSWCAALAAAPRARGPSSPSRPAGGQRAAARAPGRAPGRALRPAPVRGPRGSRASHPGQVIDSPPGRKSPPPFRCLSSAVAGANDIQRAGPPLKAGEPRTRPRDNLVDDEVRSEIWSAFCSLVLCARSSPEDV